jgi:hypothetical protein
MMVSLAGRAKALFGQAKYLARVVHNDALLRSRGRCGTVISCYARFDCTTPKVQGRSRGSRQSPSFVQQAPVVHRPPRSISCAYVAVLESIAAGAVEIALRLRTLGIRAQRKFSTALAVLFCLPKGLGSVPGKLHKEKLWPPFEKSIGQLPEFFIVTPYWPKNWGTE